LKLSNEDKILLKDLCREHQVDYKKVLMLLDTIQEYEFKDRRIGVYDALRNVLKTLPEAEV